MEAERGAIAALGSFLVVKRDLIISDPALAHFFISFGVDIARSSGARDPSPPLYTAYDASDFNLKINLTIESVQDHIVAAEQYPFHLPGTPDFAAIDASQSGINPTLVDDHLCLPSSTLELYPGPVDMIDAEPKVMFNQVWQEGRQNVSWLDE